MAKSTLTPAQAHLDAAAAHCMAAKANSPAAVAKCVKRATDATWAAGGESAPAVAIEACIEAGEGKGGGNARSAEIHRAAALAHAQAAVEALESEIDAS